MAIGFHLDDIEEACFSDPQKMYELNVEIRNLKKQLKTVRVEAIKEFAERLKEKTKTHITMHIYDNGVYKPIAEIFIADIIDNLVKEMTEENNAES